MAMAHSMSANGGWGWGTPSLVLFQCSQQNELISTQCLEPFGIRLKVFIGSS